MRASKRVRVRESERSWMGKMDDDGGHMVGWSTWWAWRAWWAACLETDGAVVAAESNGNN
jgi:hypothetical protein